MDRGTMLRKAVGLSVLAVLVSTSMMVTDCYAWKKDKDKAKGVNQAIKEEKQAAASGSKTIVVPGDKVTIEYVGKLEDGTVFSQSDPAVPFTFIASGGRIVPGLDKAVQGMLLNEEKDVTVSSQDAYGPRNESLVREFPLAALPETVKPEVGMRLQLKDQAGKPFVGTITEITDTVVKVDLNHRLAGKTLNFHVKVVNIE